MDFVDFGIIVLAALMIWLLYRATQETRAYGAEQRKFAPRHVRTQKPSEEHIGHMRRSA
jgi:hypothetical protein